MTQSSLLAVKSGEKIKIVVPKSFQQQILKECHDVPSIRRVGMCRTIELLDRQFHWQGLWGDVNHYAKTYPTYQIMKSDHWAKAELLYPLEIPTRK